MKLCLLNAPWYSEKDKWHGIRTCRWPFIMNSPKPEPDMFGSYNSFPFFMAQTAGYLAKIAGMKEIFFYDALANAHSYDKFYDVVNNVKPEITIMEISTPSIENDLEIAGNLKKMGSEIAFVGPHATVFAKDLIKHPSVDYVLQGEYEIGAYLMSMMRKPGIYKCRPIINIDTIPFPYRDNSIYLYADGFGQDKYINYPQLQIMACYDNKTDILTEDGWKNFAELTYRDKVCTLNPNTNCIEYHKPLEIQKKSYSGEMYKIKSKQIDLVVTPEHEIYCSRFDYNKFELRTIKDIVNKPCLEFKKDGYWIGMNKKYFILPYIKYPRMATTQKVIRKIKMDDFLEFLGYYISEGNARCKKKTNNYIIQISQNTGEKREKIKDCIRRIGYKFHETKVGIFISNKQLYNYLKKFGYCYEKYIPKNFKKLCKRQLLILLDALMLGDGNIYKDTYTYFSTSKKLMDDVQEMLLKIGFSGNIKLKKTKDVFIKGRKIKASNCKRCYRIAWNKKENTPRLNYNGQKHISKINYNGNIYDCTVPNHIIYVRRNGIVCWSGNSRGCPYTCNFCLWRHTMTNGYYRKRRVKCVMKEITSAMRQWHFNSVLFDDDTFNIGDKHTIEYAEALGHIDIQWHAMVRADACSWKAFNIMAANGCVGLKIGVETFSQRGLDYIKKGCNSNELIETLDFLIERGFKIFLSLMGNIPTETDEDREYTKKWLKYFINKGASFQNPECMPLPGTPLYKITEKKESWKDYGKYS